MKVYVLKKWKVTDLVGYWVNNGVTAEISKAESYLEGDRANRDYDEYDLDVSDLSYNQIFGEKIINNLDDSIKVLYYKLKKI